MDRIVRFDEPAEPFTSDRIREIQAAEQQTLEASAARGGPPVHEGETEYPETIPPIEDIFSDDDGRIWIARLEPPPNVLPSGMGRASRRWVILSPDGEEVIGEIVLPQRSRPLYADGQGVLLLTVDEVDVPYVEWWPLQ